MSLSFPNTINFALLQSALILLNRSNARLEIIPKEFSILKSKIYSTHVFLKLKSDSFNQFKSHACTFTKPATCALRRPFMQISKVIDSLNDQF